MKTLLSLTAVAFLLLLLGGQGALVRLLYLPVSCLLAILCLRKRPDLYMDLLLWSLLLSPFLRRVADYQAGWKDPSTILLTPYAVALLAPTLGWRKLATTPLRSVLPFLFALLAILSGLVVGFTQQRPSAVIAAAPTWLMPLLFAWWFFTCDPQLRQTLLRSFHRTLLPGMLLVGLYGCVQFVTAPAWDRNWLIQLGSILDVNSMGVPEPYQMRVFSTLNSPGVCAFVLAASILYLSTLRRWTALPVIAAALVCLVLTQGRSGFLCLGVGLLVLLLRLPKAAIRILSILAALTLALLPLVLAGPGRDLILGRITSMASPRNDVSTISRTQGLVAAFHLIEEHPLGLGIGVDEGIIAKDGSYSLHDNGLVEAFLTLGWIGGALFLAAPLALLASRRPSTPKPGPVAIASASACLALISQFLLGSSFLGIPGFFLWFFAALSSTALELPAAKHEQTNRDGHKQTLQMDATAIS